MYDGDNNKLLSLSKKCNPNYLKVSRLEIFLALEYFDTIRNTVKFSKQIYRLLKGMQYKTPDIISKEWMPEKQRSNQEDFVTYREMEAFFNGK